MKYLVLTLGIIAFLLSVAALEGDRVVLCGVFFLAAISCGIIADALEKRADI